MQCSERSVLSTLAQALELAAGRIAGFHVCDQQVPLTDVLLSRDLPGDGPIEVEVFNAEVWSRPGEQVLREVIAAYRKHVID